MKQENNCALPQEGAFRTTIGGQALIEGILDGTVDPGRVFDVELPLSEAAEGYALMDRREALKDALLDEAEGADLLMVKPAGAYLDVIRDLRAALDRQRLVKDAHELDCMQRAADIAAAGHARAMARCRPGLAEYELEAELTYEFRRRGASSHAYPPIVAGGANACVLHYVENDKLLADGALVLIDAGCEVEGYASDITRTFPVNGRFSAAQRDVYEIVLAAQAAAIDATRPGVAFMAPHDAAVRVLTRGMVDLGLLKGDLDTLIEGKAYSRFYMHRTGHWLGLDVHDAGEYKEGDNWVTLQPGMTLTVEPGLYIRPGDDVPAHLHGIGIRIEDDVAVTADGCRVYTTAPRTVAEIEAVMEHLS